MSASVTVERLTKTYRLGVLGAVTLQEDVQRWWARLRGGPDPFATVGGRPRAGRGRTFNALDDVGFRLDEGEVVGVLGRNGAGKSTLLKILSEITGPTAGTVTLRGRVASLLEVGTGFHPDLTGRENVFLNGAILGMTQAEIRAQFDAIVAFSECEAFIDTPVKRYSSGMFVRLAFAVAAHLEQEILIVDEVLAVGDASFQQKCLGKMEEVGRTGRTILFVSHQLSSIQRLCSRALVLEDGRLVHDGDVSSGVSRYLLGAAVDGDGRRMIEVAPEEARIVSWRLVDRAPGLTHCCHSRERVTIEMEVEAGRAIPYAHLGLVLRTLGGERAIAALSIDDFRPRFALPRGTSRIRATLRLPLRADRYRLELTLADEQWHIWDQWHAEPLLTILADDHSALPPEKQGLVSEPVEFEVS